MMIIYGKKLKIQNLLNLNNNKINLDKLLEKYDNDENRKNLLNTNKDLITYLEENDYTVSCCYKQKKFVIAICLEIFLSFGFGHLYRGDKIVAFMKMSVY